MASTAVIIKILITVVYGAALGIITIPLAKKLALSRTEDPADVAPLNKRSVQVFSLVLGIAATAGLTFTAGATDLYIRNLLLLVPIFGLSFVDAVVRKIPNPLLLCMLVIEAGYLIYHCISEQSVDILPRVFGGFFVGMIVCLIPSVLKIPMGAGDIKYSGVIGICVYAIGYFQAMVLMSLLIGIYYLYLKATKKGDLKTQVPMGPFLSVGTVVSMCFSVMSLFGVNIIF